MEKINIAELLKDCPQGMELDCAVFDNIVFNGSISNCVYPIKVMTKDGSKGLNLTKYGCTSENKNAKCIIFPKGKTTWEGFVSPCKFKNGDIISMENACGCHTFIYNNITNEDGSYGYYAIITSMGNFKVNNFCSGSKYRLATEEEKEKLFKAIKDNGYKWNSESKTLEELQKFRDGDIIFTNTNTNNTWISIFKEIHSEGVLTYVDYLENGSDDYSNLYICEDLLCVESDIICQRLATEEEKQKLFNAIKAKGYHWNAETKTLEELPKFRKCDWVIDKQGLVHQIANVIENVTNHTYGYDIVGGGYFNDNTEGVRLWTIKDAKDGDVLCDYIEGYNNPLIFILKKFEHVNFGLAKLSDYSSYCFLTAGDKQSFKEGKYHHKHNIKPATKEQSELLFQKIKEAGYKWNAETKILDVLPKFRVGDKVRHKDDKTVIIITGIKDNYYLMQFYNIRRRNYQNEKVLFKDQDDYVILNKFDINTLVPFESKVLVRNSYSGFWKPAFWGVYEAERSNEHQYRNYLTTEGFVRHCIPYNDETKYLVGKTCGCPEYYKTWED